MLAKLTAVEGARNASVSETQHPLNILTPSIAPPGLALNLWRPLDFIFRDQRLDQAAVAAL